MSRKQKLDSLLHEKIAEIINQRLDRPLDFLITIVKVDTSPDLSHAKIYFSALPENKENEAKKFLIINSAEIKKWLAKDSVLRKIPRFRYVLEETEKKAQEVEKILNKIKKDENN